MKLSFPSLQQLFAGAIQVATRFPFTLALALIGTVSAVISANDFGIHEDNIIEYVKTIFSCQLGLPLLLAISLMGERKILPLGVWPWRILAAIALFSYYWTFPSEPSIPHFIFHILFTIGFHLLVSYAPYIGYNEEQNGFWQYNEKLFTGILTALLYTYVLFAGLALSLGSVQALFDVDIKLERYTQLFFILQGLFNTWFFLSIVPKNFEALNTSKAYPLGLKIFTQYVLLPLVSIYLLILLGYLFKIIINWSLPKGWVSYLVIGFSVVGILSLLLIHPIRNNKNNKWILTYSRLFYFALLPLVGLLTVAIYTRLSDYGITENRYFIMVLAAWLLGITLYFIFSKQKNIKIIPLTLSLLAFAAAVGPFSATNVSLKSQKNRLVSILTSNQIWQNGQMNPVSSESISKEDNRNISSILYYFQARERLADVGAYFGEKGQAIIAENNYSSVDKLMDLAGVSSYKESNATAYGLFRLSYPNENIIPISGYDYHFVIKHNYQEELELPDGKKVKYTYYNHAKNIELQVGNKAPVVLELTPFVNDLLVKYDAQLRRSYADASREELSLEKENEDLKVKVIFPELSISLNKKELRELNLREVYVLIKLKK